MVDSPETEKNKEGQGASSSSKWRTCFVILIVLIVFFCVLPIFSIAIDEDPFNETKLPFLPTPATQDFPEKNAVTGLLFQMDKRHQALDSPDFMALKYGDADWSREGEVTRANEPSLRKIREIMKPVFDKEAARAVPRGQVLTGKKSVWTLMGRHWNRHINLLQRENRESESFQEAIALLEFSRGLRGLYSYDETGGGMILSRGAIKKIIHLSRDAKDFKKMSVVLKALNRFEVSTKEARTWLSRDYRRKTQEILSYAKAKSDGESSGASGIFGRWLYKTNQTHRIVATAYKNAYDFVDRARSPYFLDPFHRCGFNEADLFRQSPDWWIGGNGLGYENFLVELPEQLRDTIMQRYHFNGLLRFAQVYLAIRVFRLRDGDFPEKLSEITKELPDHFFSNQKPFEFAYEKGAKLEILMTDAIYKDGGDGMMIRTAEKIRISAASFNSAKRPRKRKR